MARGRVDVKRRISILMDVWNKVLELWEESGGSLSRGDVVKILRDVYEKESVKPLKGASNPSDLYDKELISLYVVGKHGMGLEEQYPELFDRIFGDEVKFESIIDIVLREPADRAVEKVKTILGDLSDNTLARILRLKMTEVFFGFSSNESFVNLIKVFSKAFPHKARTFENYIRFYIAFKVAEAIARGEVRDRISKEALKHALAIELGLNDKRKLPDDNYISKIALEVFNVPLRSLTGILSITRGSKQGVKPGSS
jgi:hypothetical protein